MKIEVIQPSGYCSGVALALKKVKEIARKNLDKQVVILGMLVHNEDALKELDVLGVKTIYDPNKSLLEMVDLINENSLVILTAHGHDIKVEEKLKERNLSFVDATCPFVNKSFDEIKKAIKENKEVLYIGKNNHPESNAAISISSHVHLVDVNEEPNLEYLKDKKVLVISQTTFSKLDINKKLEEIKKTLPQAEIHNGVCFSSSARQEALLSLNKDVELIYVVGSKKSNNTKTLFELAKKNYPSSKVLLIENEKDVNKKDLTGLSYVAISSGASTPNEVIEKIKLEISSLSD